MRKLSPKEERQFDQVPVNALRCPFQWPFCPSLILPSFFTIPPSLSVIKDLTLMAALGFGFLSSSFRRHSWSSVAFNLFMLALGVQGSVLLDHFLSWTSQKDALSLLR